MWWSSLSLICETNFTSTLWMPLVDYQPSSLLLKTKPGQQTAKWIKRVPTISYVVGGWIEKWPVWFSTCLFCFGLGFFCLEKKKKKSVHLILSALCTLFKIHPVSAEAAKTNAEEIFLKSCHFLGISWLCLSLSRT